MEQVIYKRWHLVFADGVVHMSAESPLIKLKGGDNVANKSIGISVRLCYNSYKQCSFSN